MSKIFKNREHAGQILADVLKKKKFSDQPLVLGIPRGGIVVGYFVALSFNTKVTAVISKKLPIPGNEEVAFGAISEDLSVFIRSGIQLTSEIIMNAIEQQMDEIERRLNIFRPGYSLPDMKGKTVIIVDDGIATGATFVPVLQLCKKRGAHRLIVAAPVSGHKVVPELYEVADEVLILEKPEIFNGVAQVYDDFKELTDEQVMKFLKNNKSI